MKRLIATLATSALLLVGLSATPAEARSTSWDVNGPTSAERGDFQQARRGCVTRSEFRRVKRGWRKSRVQNLFDTRGRISLVLFGEVTKDYRACPRFSAVSVTYKRNRVVSKFAIFL
jgi:hypothetical protein